MKCKICDLENSHPEAFESINDALKRSLKMLSFTKELNQLYNLNITPNNVSRHKSHYLKIKSSQVIEINKEDLKKTENKQKDTLKTGAFLSNSASTITFPDLKPQYLKFLMYYRANGYKNKEEAGTKAGFKDKKKVYKILKIPEVQAALYEIRSVDFINLRITGNQIIAGIGKIAHAPEYRHKMYNDDGELITNINEWPEELRCSLNDFDYEKTVSIDQEGAETTKEKFKFKFESQLAAFKELRKHFMEVDLYKLGEEKRLIHERAIAILNKRKEEHLNLNETMQLFEIEGLPFPESLKLEIKDFDWELEKRIRKAESDAKKALKITSGAS